VARRVLDSDNWRETALLLASCEADDLPSVRAALVVEGSRRSLDPERLAEELAFLDDCVTSGVATAWTSRVVESYSARATQCRQELGRHDDESQLRRETADLALELVELLCYGLRPLVEEPGAVLREASEWASWALARRPDRTDRTTLLRLRSMAGRGLHELTGEVGPLDQATRDARAARRESQTDAERAETSVTVANCLMDRWRLTGRRRWIDEAVALYRESLALAPLVTGGEVAQLQANLLAALHERWECYGDEDDRRAFDDELDAVETMSGEQSSATIRLRGSRGPGRAMAMLEEARQALMLCAPGTPSWVDSVRQLAGLLAETYQHSNDQAHIREAITRYRELLGSGKLDRIDQPVTRLNLASAVLELLESARDDELLEMALDAAETAVAEMPPGSPDLSFALGVAASARLARYEALNDADDLHRGLAAARASLAATRRRSPRHAAQADRTGSALRALFELVADGDVLAEAVRLARRAVSVSPGADHRSAAYRANLAVALAATSTVTGRRGELRRAAGPDPEQEAIDLLNEVIASCPARSPDRPTYLANLGAIWAERWHRSAVEADGQQAIDLFRQALASVPGRVTDPGRRLERLRIEANLAALEYSTGTAAGDRRRQQVGRRRYRRVLAPGSGTPLELRVIAAGAWAAFAAQAGRWTEALIAYQEALHLGESLVSLQPGEVDRLNRLRQISGVANEAALAAAEVGDLELAVELADRGRAVLLRGPGEVGLQALPSDAAAIMAAAAGSPLVYVLSGPRAGAALVVRSDRITSVPLPHLTTTEVLAQTRMLYDAYNGRHARPGRWRAALERIGGWAWLAAMGQVLDVVGPDASIGLLPAGSLALLPMHAAWRDEPGDGQRRYVADRAAVRYLPSARFSAPAAQPVRSIAAIGVPADFDWTNDELGWASAPFEIVTALSPPSSIGDLVHAMEGADVIHISAHGALDTLDPLNSRLNLGPAGPLTGTDVSALSLGARLVFLSACDTGLPWYKAPDEAVGMTSAFLRAGASGVIAATWSVPEFATALLVNRFYQLWPHTVSDGAAALRQAQLWLRDSTNEAKAELIGFSVSDLTLQERGARIHEHPYFWAGFSYVGR